LHEQHHPPEKPLSLLKSMDWGFFIVATISLASALYVLWRDGLGVAQHILIEDATLFVTILPKVALGCLIGGLVRLLISRETISRYIGEGSGWRGLVIAAAIGGLFPGGPFTIFPLAVILLASGADRGSAIAFISSWLLLGINRAIIWEMPFFGLDFVALRFLLSLPMPILLGLLARAPIFDRLYLPVRDLPARAKGEELP
jgi:uncharacterized membrane protein YraQ (UPF0718 family)